MTAVAHWLFLSWVPGALFTLSPFNTDLSELADVQTER